MPGGFQFGNINMKTLSSNAGGISRAENVDRRAVLVWQPVFAYAPGARGFRLHVKDGARTGTLLSFQRGRKCCHQPISLVMEVVMR